ncbi:hypothetical protein L596_009545 [Steinernema carpocapsae]|uniref:Uncharacterized protein n=1 Tax=Steinernema carpocapsae TaxID=34508 RepID=A0A4U5PG65_STECR|nr:hypothetical protein L596_009545 [Steinernema carpocapsae]
MRHKRFYAGLEVTQAAPTLSHRPHSLSQVKRAFDSLTGSGFSEFDKLAFDSFMGFGFTGMDKRGFHDLARIVLKALTL